MRSILCVFMALAFGCSPEIQQFDSGEQTDLSTSNLDWDQDGDLVDDLGSDNCPGLANPVVPIEAEDVLGCAGQKFGFEEGDFWQPDFDCDGLGDACDGDADNDGFPACKPGQDPGNPPACEPREDDFNFDIHPEVPPGARDSDRDTISDDRDNCPNHPNAHQEDLDEDDIGDLCDEDIDGDGVPDGRFVPEDLDGDWVSVENGDCNDGNPNVSPWHREVCDNGVDDDCDGQIDENCNECVPNFFPDDQCGDGEDDNCNGEVDEECLQCEGREDCEYGLGPISCHDGLIYRVINYGHCWNGMCATGYLWDSCPFGCDSPARFERCRLQADLDQDGYSPQDGDCNDDDHKINPGAGDKCDGVDNNCDGVVDNNPDYECVPCQEDVQCPGHDDPQVNSCNENGNLSMEAGMYCDEAIGFCEPSSREEYCHYGCLDDECVDPGWWFLGICTILTCEGDGVPDLDDALACEEAWTGEYDRAYFDEREVCQEFAASIYEAADCISWRESCHSLADGQMSEQCSRALSNMDRLEGLARDAQCGMLQDEQEEEEEEEVLEEEVIEEEVEE